jgi:hypothetical protein
VEVHFLKFSLVEVERGFEGKQLGGIFTIIVK